MGGVSSHPDGGVDIASMDSAGRDFDGHSSGPRAAAELVGTTPSPQLGTQQGGEDHDCDGTRSHSRCGSPRNSVPESSARRKAWPDTGGALRIPRQITMGGGDGEDTRADDEEYQVWVSGESMGQPELIHPKRMEGCWLGVCIPLGPYLYTCYEQKAVDQNSFQTKGCLFVFYPILPYSEVWERVPGTNKFRKQHTKDIGDWSEAAKGKACSGPCFRIRLSAASGSGQVVPVESMKAQPLPIKDVGFHADGGFFLLRDADFKGRDDRSSSEPCSDLEVAKQLVARKPKRHDVCYALREKQLVSIPAVDRNEMQNGAKWSHGGGAHLIVFGNDTGHRSHNKILIALKDVDCCFGDGKVFSGVRSYDAALRKIRELDDTNQTAYFFHSSSGRLIEKPKGKKSNWVGYPNYGWLFLWADAHIAGGSDTGGGTAPKGPPTSLRDEKAMAQAPDAVSPSGRVFSFVSVSKDTFDQSGILYAIGTSFGKAPYTNPADSGKVAVHFSDDCANFYSKKGGHKTFSDEARRQAASVICANRHPGHGSSQWSRGEPGAWFTVDLLDVLLVPTHFAYRNDSAGNDPTHFALEGSNNGDAGWTLISKHSHEKWPEGKGAKHWSISGATKPFTRFRIRNEGGPKHLCCAGFELYGRVVEDEAKARKAEAKAEEEMRATKEKLQEDQRERARLAAQLESERQEFAKKEAEMREQMQEKLDGEKRKLDEEKRRYEETLAAKRREEDEKLKLDAQLQDAQSPGLQTAVNMVAGALAGKLNHHWFSESKYAAIRLILGSPERSDLKECVGLNDPFEFSELLKNPLKAMRREWMAAGSENDQANFDYVCRGTVAPDEYPDHVKESLRTGVYHGGAIADGEFDTGHQGMDLKDFTNHEISRLAGLQDHHVAAIRLYTSSSYPLFNQPMRNGVKPHPIRVTMYCLSEGLLKLRKVGAKTDPEGYATTKYLWRGMKDREMDLEAFKTRGGTELAPMSTTSSREVADSYAGVGQDGHASLLFRYTTKALSRGVLIDYLSMYPKEKEFLYPPLTSLTYDDRGDVMVEGNVTIVPVDPQMA